MNKPAPMPIPTPSINKNKNDIKFINEHKLNYENTLYLIKIGKIVNENEEIIIFVKNENETVNTGYYQNSFSLENLQKINKIFRQFDKVDETIDALQDIINEKNMSIKKENDEIFVVFKFKKIGKGEEEIKLKLLKNNIETGKIIENLISNINSLKLEVENFKKEINAKKFIKYSPTLENGWIVDPNTLKNL